MELVFGAIMVVGVLYLLLTVLGGVSEIFDIGIDDAMDSIGLSDVFGMDTGASDATGLGCAVLSAFRLPRTGPDPATSPFLLASRRTPPVVM